MDRHSNSFPERSELQGRIGIIGKGNRQKHCQLSYMTPSDGWKNHRHGLRNLPGVLRFPFILQLLRHCKWDLNSEILFLYGYKPGCYDLWYKHSIEHLTNFFVLRDVLQTFVKVLITISYSFLLLHNLYQAVNDLEVLMEAQGFQEVA